MAYNLRPSPDSHSYKTLYSIYRTLRLYPSNRSLRAWGVLIRYFWLRISGDRVPPFVYLAVTYDCQCCCKHCYANAPIKDNSKNLDSAQCKSVIEQIKKLGAIGIVFTGGEPLLREDLAELVNFAHNRGLLTRIDTNGLLLDREHILPLKKAGITQICVSIDDADPETHDRGRNYPGAFKKATEGIRLLREYKIPTQIFTYVNKKNVAEGIQKIIGLAKKYKVFCIQLLFPLAAGRWEHAYEQVLTDKEKEKIKKLNGPPFIHFVSPGKKELCEICTRATLYISAHGEVKPCPAVPYSMGSLIRNTLLEIWDLHCSRLNIKFRGECPLNRPESRALLKKYVDSLAVGLAKPEQDPGSS